MDPTETTTLPDAPDTSTDTDGATNETALEDGQSSGEHYDWMDDPAPGIEAPEAEFTRRRNAAAEVKDELKIEDETTDDADQADAKDGSEKDDATPDAADPKAVADENADADQEEPDGDKADDTPSPFLDTVSSVVGKHFKSEKDAAEAIRSMKDENQGYQALGTLLEGNADLGNFFHLMIEKNLSPAEAAAEAWKGQLDLNEPDPVDDPDGFAEYQRKKGREEALKETQTAQQNQQQQRVDRARQDVERAAAAFREKHGLSDEDASAFFDEFKLYRLGDPDTGRVPADIFERERKARNYDADVKAAHEKGLVEGRNEATKNITGRRGNRGDGIPALNGRTTPVTEPTGAERESRDRRRRFKGDGQFDHSWPE